MLDVHPFLTFSVIPDLIGKSIFTTKDIRRRQGYGGTGGGHREKLLILSKNIYCFSWRPCVSVVHFFPVIPDLVSYCFSFKVESWTFSVGCSLFLDFTPAPCALHLEPCAF
jgi:hypothetical protein